MLILATLSCPGYPAANITLLFFYAMANPAVKVGRQKESFGESVIGLENAMHKVLRSTKEMKEAEANAREVRRLQAEMEMKNEVIAENDVVNRALMDRFEARAAEWQEEKVALQKSLEAVKADQKSTMSKKLDGALKEAKTAKEDAFRTHAKLLEADAQVTVLKVQLKNTRTELTGLRNCIGLVESTEKLLVVSF